MFKTLPSSLLRWAPVLAFALHWLRAAVEADLHSHFLEMVPKGMDRKVER